MKLVQVMQKSPTMLDKIIGKCPICSSWNTDAVLITIHDFTPEDAPKSNKPIDLREKRHHYHEKCMEENIENFPDYMQLRNVQVPSQLKGIYHIRYLYDCISNPKNLSKSSLVH